MKHKGNFVFFWTGRDVFSNWHSSPFVVNNTRFAHGEQWMMYCKAKLFDDHEMAEKILAETDPKENKKQGKNVRGFVETVWKANAKRLVKIGLREKYLQNPRMLRTLLSTQGKRIVEASPYDRIWGIGMAMDHPDATNPDRWKGQNLLGEAHDEVRDELLKLEALPERAEKAVRSALRSLASENSPTP